MEEQKDQGGNSAQDIFSNLKVRTMQDDLRKLGGQAIPATPSRPAPGVALSNQTSSGARIPPPSLPIAQKQVSTPLTTERIVSLKPQPKEAPSPPPHLPTQPLPSIPPIPPSPPPVAAPTAFKELPTRTAKPFLKLGIVFGSLILVIAGALLAYFYWPASQLPQPPPPIEQPVPSPLFSMENKEVVAVTDIDLMSLPGKIADVAKNEKPPGTFVQVIFKHADGEQKYFTAEEAFNGFNIADLTLQCEAGATSTDCLKNPRLIDNIENEYDQYSVFLYYQKQSTSTISTSTPFVRLGIIAKLKDAQKAKKILNASEPLLTGYFAGLMINGVPLTGGNFQENFYKSKTIRYVNLPDKNLSVDYAVWSDYLLITTSKESALSSIDRFSLQ